MKQMFVNTRNFMRITLTEKFSRNPVRSVNVLKKWSSEASVSAGLTSSSLIILDTDSRSRASTGADGLLLDASSQLKSKRSGKSSDISTVQSNWSDSVLMMSSAGTQEDKSGSPGLQDWNWQVWWDLFTMCKAIGSYFVSEDKLSP